MTPAAETPLKVRAAKSGVWAFLIQAASRALSFVRMVILARLLLPEDFGLMGVALLFLSVIDVFSKTGFAEKLIQEKGDIERFLDSAWTALFARGVLLFAAVVFAAPYVATFFNKPEAAPVVIAVGAALVLQGANNIGVVYFQRLLDFKRQFVYEFSGVAADFLVSISCAFLLRSVWALAAGYVAGNVAKLVASFVLSPVRPRIKLESRKIKKLFGFGKWVFASGVLVFLITQGDDILVGKMLGVYALGLYQVAYRISTLALTEITRVISKVSFPLYSRIQDDRLRLGEAYAGVIRLVSFAAVPITVVLVFLSRELVLVLLGEKWVEIAPALSVLALAGFARAVAATAGELFYAVGKPRTDTALQLLRFIAMAVFIYPLTKRLGILGTALSVLFGILVVTPFFVGRAAQEAGIEPKKLLRILGCPLMCGLVMTAFVVFAKSVFGGALLALVFGAAAGAAAYAAATYIADKAFRCGMLSLLRSVWDAARAKPSPEGTQRI